MYERATRFTAGRSVVAGAFVLAIGLCDGIAVQPASAQVVGRPSVIVDETVLEKLGPAPQSLPDVILQQQPQAYRPAPRPDSSPGAMQEMTQGTPSTDQLLPPPSAMPRSRVMLPRALQPAEPSPPRSAPAPQVARVPKAAPKPAPAPVEKTPVVPTEIEPPAVAKIPETPKVAPPPTPRVEAPKAADVTPPAVPEPSEPPVAKVEAEAPPAAPLPKVEPPAPPVAAEPEPATPPVPSVAAAPEPTPPPAAPMPEKPETAAIPAPPAIVPPAPAAKAEPSPTLDAPQKETAPRQLSAAAQDTEPRQESPSAPTGAQTGTQMASLPAAASPAEILDDGQLYRIPFGSDSSDISEDGKQYLDELAQRMKSDSSLRLQILGYAGSTQDSASKARRASLFRALSVRTYLMKQGIRSTRMDVRALGNLVEDGAPDRVDAVVRK